MPFPRILVGIVALVACTHMSAAHAQQVVQNRTLYSENGLIISYVVERLADRTLGAPGSTRSVPAYRTVVTIDNHTDHSIRFNGGGYIDFRDYAITGTGSARVSFGGNQLIPPGRTELIDSRTGWAHAEHAALGQPSWRIPSWRTMD